MYIVAFIFMRSACICSNAVVVVVVVVDEEEEEDVSLLSGT
jgi:hypothetical protein